MHALDASEMQHLPAFRNFVILAVIIASSVALADEDAKFIYEVCMHGMTTQPSMPRSESETFCFCTADEVKKSITPKQRSSIRDARNRMQSGQTVSQEVFIKSGLKMLVETSQEYCMGIQYPEPEKISAIEHKKYSSLANKSVREFNSLLNARCKKYPKSKERRQCLVDASKEWLNAEGGKYVEFPANYITGNGLAETLIEKFSASNP